MTLNTLCSFRVNGKPCGAPCQGGKCAKHKAAARARDNARREAARPDRPARQDRGYDSDYERNRKRMVEMAWAMGHACVKCGKPFARKEDITAEHLKPVRLGGNSDAANLAPCHSECNSSWRT